MANNRLYIVNTKTKEYSCIAKHSDGSWGLGNVDILKEILEDCYDPDEQKETNFLLITENSKLFKSLTTDGYNYNQTNKWEYF